MSIYDSMNTTKLSFFAFCIRLAIMLILAIVAAFTVSPYFVGKRANYSLGQFTPNSIRAPFDFSVIDEAATEKAKQEATRKTIPVAEWDTRRPAEVKNELIKIFSPAGRLISEAALMEVVPAEELAKIPAWKRSTIAKTSKIKADNFLNENMDKEFTRIEESIGFRFEPREKRLFLPAYFNDEFLRKLLSLIDDMYSGQVTQDLIAIREEVDGDPEKKDGPGKLALRDIQSGEMTTISDLTAIREAEQIGPILQEKVKILFPDLEELGRAVIMKIVQPRIKVNLRLDKKETELRRQAARSAILPIAYNFKKNQLIIGEGQEITPQKLLVLEHLNKLSLPDEYLNRLWGMVLLFLFSIMAGYSTIDYSSSDKRLRTRDYIFLAAGLSLAVISFRIWLQIENGVLARYPEIPPLAWMIVFPFAALPMSTRFLLSFKTAVAQATLSALMFATISQLGVSHACYAFAIGMAAIYLTGGHSRRVSLLVSGAKIGLLSMLGATALFVMDGEGELSTYLLVIGGALFSGVFSSFIVLATNPLAEWLFGYSTDITLLERSNYDHPLLKRIMFETPGTFQHSISIGILAEASAKVVGANALLVRIGALYHDVGKSANPKYFTENQTGDNPHDALPPLQSAQIIKAHVSDGVFLATKYKMDQRILDFILEHHGTSLIKYFFVKASKDDPSAVEADYHYPGPKPRSKETGIMMIADQVEATARSLSDPTENDFRAMISKTIERIRLEGQLDDCPLTLSDLAKIHDAMATALVGIHHRRIKYPEQKIEKE